MIFGSRRDRLKVKAGITFRNMSKLDPYEAALRMAGIEPVRLRQDSSGSLDAVDGLILTGGSDVNPIRYGQARVPECGEADDARDEFESHYIREALAKDFPILAICRGIQILNVELGGTLTQHLPTTGTHRMSVPGEEPGRHSAAHSVRVLSGSRLGEIVGVGECDVNSRHHQAVDRVGQGLIVSAVANDGVVEALEKPGDLFVVAVQWHPEDRVLANEHDRNLFAAFAVAMAKAKPAGKPAAV